MGTAITSKVRRHSGRVTPRIVGSFNMAEVVEQGLEPQPFWDDWKNYRDGQRVSRDRKLLRSPYMCAAGYLNVKKWNERLKNLILRRKLKQNKVNFS